MQSKLRIGTRKSDLALTQTSQVIDTLQKVGFESEAKQIVTTGDRDSRPFHDIIGDGFFTKEIERNILFEKIELAVHSAKDLPSQIHKCAPWVAYGERESTQDLLIIKRENIISENPLVIKDDTVIGTSSPRRTAQLQLQFPNSKIKSIRGNVATRLDKVLNGEVNGTILAKAGINRLRLFEEIKKKGLLVFDLDFVTAPCQGVLGVQGHQKYKEILDQIENKDLTEIALAEKSVLALLGGGCHLALGCKIQKKKSSYELNFFLNVPQDNKNKSKNILFNTEAENIEQLLKDLFCHLSEAKKTSPRVIVTQPIQHQLKIAKKMAQNDLLPLPWVMREVLPTFDPNDLENLRVDLKEFDALVFTSQFSVRIFMNEFVSQYPEVLDVITKLKIYSVGETTRAELLNYGLKDILVPPEAHAGSLITVMDAKNPLLMGSSESALLKLAKKQGRNYKFLNLYESFPSKSHLSRLPALKDNDKLVLTNPLCAVDFVNLHRQNPSYFQHLKVFAFGPSTSKILTEAKIEHIVNTKSGSWNEMIKILKAT